MRSGKRSTASRRYPLFAIGAVVVVVMAMVGLSVYNHAKTPATPGSSATRR